MTTLTVTLDAVDCIFVVNELEQAERYWRTRGVEGRADKLRRVREAIERAVYGGQTALERVEVRLP